jgi:glycosyltransferase involved in cell wall biosynthesis
MIAVKKRIAFITNRPSHYRTPIFSRLADLHDIDFFFTAAKPGRWWTSRQSTAWTGIRGAYVTSGSLYRALRRKPYDAVIVSLGGRSHLGAVAAAASRSRVPMILWVDMWFYPRTITHNVGRPLVHHLLRRADSVVSCGSHVTRWIEDEAGRTHAIYEMPNAVDNDHFARTVGSEELAGFRARHRLDGFTASFVGRLEPEKGLGFLLQALRGCGESIDLVVAGDGSLRKPLTDLSHDLGISRRVRFIGWLSQNDLPTLYHASNLLVLPSISTRLVKETWGLTVNEAMNAGLPVIATDAVGAAVGGLVEDGVTGWVVPERNAPALTRALDEAASSSALRVKRGQQARTRVGRFTFEAAVAAFESALGDAIVSHRAPSIATEAQDA